MFSNVSCQSINNSQTDCWSGFFALPVDNYYSAADNNKTDKEEEALVNLDLSFEEDDKCERKLTCEKDLSDSDSTEYDSHSLRSVSSRSLSFLYEKENPKFTNILSNNWEANLNAVKTKYNQVLMAQKVANTKKMMVANMMKNQAMAQMMVTAKNNAVQSELTNTVSA